MIITAVILTVYNRRKVTLQGLSSLYKAIKTIGEGYLFDIYMTDDGCSDGTAEAVAQEFPKVKIIHGDGNLYWSGGMRMAWQAAISSGIKYDYYLWFNDDTTLYEDSIRKLMQSGKNTNSESIIIGTTVDESGLLSYGGRDIHKKIIEPDERNEKRCITFNGNIVLIPQAVYRILGNIDKLFSHSLGDFDYGFRATERGFTNYITPGIVGICNRHISFPRWCDPKKTLVERINHYYSPTGNPPLEVFIYECRHWGISSALFHLITNHIRLFIPILWKNRQI